MYGLINKKREIIVKKYLALFALTLIQSCSSGGGDSTPAPTTTNSTGFPEVSGRYSFNTSTFNISCSDGSTATNPAIALNFDITQNANVITVVNTNASGGIPGITILDTTGTTGNVQTDSSFIATQISTATITGITGTVSLNYNISGKFTSNGWSGTYIYNMSTASLGTCTFTSPFSGSKISAVTAAKISNAPYDFENVQIDLYDSFSAIASLFAKE